jgi:hypothetical protein
MLEEFEEDLPERCSPNPDREPVVVCGECGGNCNPDCGRHPWGCRFSGTIYGEWDIHPHCTLLHLDVATAIARRNFEFWDCGTKLFRSNFAK